MLKGGKVADEVLEVSVHLDRTTQSQRRPVGCLQWLPVPLPSL